MSDRPFGKRTFQGHDEVRLVSIDRQLSISIPVEQFVGKTTRNTMGAAGLAIGLELQAIALSDLSRVLADP